MVMGADRIYPVTRGPGGQLQAVSSFGPDQTTTGPSVEVPEVSAHALYNSERSRVLGWRERYYTCRQHDDKAFDFDGRVCRSGSLEGSPTVIGGNMPSFYVPMAQRRPCAPYRLGRSIVKAFTRFVFGEDRWPQMRSDDPATQDFCEELVRCTKLGAKMISARNKGGACGSVVLAWAFVDGVPRVRVVNAKHVHVTEWEDAEELVPRVAVHLYQTMREGWDPKKRQVVRTNFWVRRDWTPEADVAYKPVLVTSEEPVWEVDEEATVIHGDGEAHVVWIQNLPSEEEGDVDGTCDYAETYEQLDSLDVINSTTVRGTNRNLDPTLVLKMDQTEIGNAIVKKGSDNALVTGTSGDARYLEITGEATNAGISLSKQQRTQVLETNQCVLADPDEVVAQGTSSVALKMMYAPMTGQGDIYRVQYGSGIQRLLEQMLRSARRRMPDLDEEEGSEDRYAKEIVVGDDGGEVEEQVEYYLELEPKVVEEPVLDDEGNPTGEVQRTEVERNPGKGRIKLEWGEWFAPTAQDKLQSVQSVGGATAGKPVMSQRTAVEVVATLYNRDAQKEWVEVEKERQAERQAQGAMFPEFGGAVPAIDALPAGAQPSQPAAPEQAPAAGAEGDEPEGTASPNKPIAAGSFELTPSAMESIVYVNEGRKQANLPPLTLTDGVTPDPDGWLTIAEFKAKRAALAQAEADMLVEEAKDKKDEEPAAPTAPAPQGQNGGPGGQGAGGPPVG